MPSKLMWQTAMCVLSCLASTAEAREPSTAEEVIAKHVEAIGGKATLDGCKTVRVTGKVTLSTGMEASFTAERKQPDKFRLVAERTGQEPIVQGSDGQVYWWMIAGQPQKMPEDLARHMKTTIPLGAVGGSHASRPAKGRRVELVGKEEVNGRQVYKLKIICKEDAEGDEEFHFIDAETFLLTRVETKKTISGHKTDAVRTFSDYRRVAGLMFAFAEKESEERGRHQYVRTIEKVEVNVDLPDDRFAMPKPVAVAQDDEPVPVIENDPAARALYDGMIAALRAADTLSFKSQYHVKARLMNLRSTYRVWLKKPNHFRMEGFHFGQDEPCGVLVGDGDRLWIYWPKGCPFQFGMDLGRDEQAAKDFYITKRTPPAAHSIGHEAGRLGSGIIMTILDLSTFHGYTDSLQPYLDAVAGRGVEKFADEQCDVIEVSYMDAQRTWKVWIARRDKIPRKLEETVRVANTIRAEEIWTDIKINEAIPDDKFVWSPPEGWKEWKQPPIEAGLLKTGTKAPDFKLASLDGDAIQLSDFRGNFVWLYKWRCG